MKNYGADIDAINGEGVSHPGRTTLAAKQAETDSNVMPRIEVVSQPARTLSIRRSLKYVFLLSFLRSAMSGLARAVLLMFEFLICVY